MSNRRAWADPARLTPDLLALYRRPLRVEGWDMALVGVSAGGGERWHGWMVGPQGKFARPTVDHIRGHNSRRLHVCSMWSKGRFPGTQGGSSAARAPVQVARARSGIHSLERAQLLAAVADAGLPLLVRGALVLGPARYAWASTGGEAKRSCRSLSMPHDRWRPASMTTSCHQPPSAGVAGQSWEAASARPGAAPCCAVQPPFESPPPPPPPAGLRSAWVLPPRAWLCCLAAGTSATRSGRQCCWTSWPRL